MLEVATRSFALRVDRSAAIDVRAPARNPGLCAGAVGGLPLPPPACFAAAPPSAKVAAANPTAATVDAVAAVFPESVGDDGSVATGAVATEAAEVVLWSRNPRSAPLTFGGQRRERGGVQGPSMLML